MPLSRKVYLVHGNCRRSLRYPCSQFRRLDTRRTDELQRQTHTSSDRVFGPACARGAEFDEQFRCHATPHPAEISPGAADLSHPHTASSGPAMTGRNKDFRLSKRRHALEYVAVEATQTQVPIYPLCPALLREALKQDGHRPVHSG
jgi:hypothetical protein